MTDAPNPLGEDLLDARLRLEDLIDRDALDELCKSFRTLFGINVQIYSDEGTRLAHSSVEQGICEYLNTTVGGRKACGATVNAVKMKDPGDDGDVVHPCFNGAAYRIVAIRYDGRRVGRLVIGPYLPAAVADPPASLFLVDSAVEPDRARSLLLKMPRAKDVTITNLAAHLKASLDLILFSGHKALLTSQMHLASVRESYRVLEDRAAKLQEAYDRLKELDRLKSNFLATVSHELRTPLTSIIGYSEMLSEGLAGALEPEQAEFVKTIHEKGEQLLMLIMGLLDLSKLESGTMAMRKNTVDIAKVLGEVLSTLTPNARKKGVKLELALEENLLAVRGDPERLRQVFINLVDNAIKFTPANGTVTMRARSLLGGDGGSGNGEGDDDESGFALLAPMEKRLEVRVLDTGIGIPPRERAKVFDAFYQVDSSSTREYGGTGLGLSIVKRLVESHGGTILIEDNAPHGTQFIVTIPGPSSTGALSVRPPPPSMPPSLSSPRPT
jgi:two-component system sensor histidine kinase BarA